MRVQSVRVTRAYVAGFGTAGSLLAGVSVLFVLASAVVSFRGWPQVADAGPAPALVLSAAPQYGVSSALAKVSRHPVRALATPRTVSAATPRVGTREAASVVHHQATPQTTIAPSPHRYVTTPTPPPTTASTTPTLTSQPPSGCAQATCSGSPANLGGVATSATGAIGAGVSATGKQLGSTVSAVSGALAGQLSAASPAVAGLVAGVGQALGAVLGSVGGAAGGAVTNTGQVLGGILGGAGQ